MLKRRRGSVAASYACWYCRRAPGKSPLRNNIAAASYASFASPRRDAARGSRSDRGRRLGRASAECAIATASNSAQKENGRITIALNMDERRADREDELRACVPGGEPARIRARRGEP